MKTYRLARYHQRTLMAQGALVQASNDEEAIKKARALFWEAKYQHDKFVIEDAE